MMRTRRITDRERKAIDKILPQRDKLITRIAYQTGLRVQDILDLHADEISKTGRIAVTESKTKKLRIVHISPALRRDVEEYARRHPNAQNLIFDVEQSTIYRSIKSAARLIGADNISAHSYRKAYAHRYYQRYGLEATRRELNHNSIATTCLYIFNLKKEDDNNGR